MQFLTVIIVLCLLGLQQVCNSLANLLIIRFVSHLMGHRSCFEHIEPVGGAIAGFMVGREVLCIHRLGGSGKSSCHMKGF